MSDYITILEDWKNQQQHNGKRTYDVIDITDEIKVYKIKKTCKINGNEISVEKRFTPLQVDDTYEYFDIDKGNKYILHDMLNSVESEFEIKIEEYMENFIKSLER
jgi:hypothetical protein